MFKAFILVVFTFNLYATDIWDEKVYSFGNLTEVIERQGSGDSTSLNQLKKLPNLYALGLSEFLQNEILVINSKPFISSVKNKKVHIDNSFKHHSSFIVYTSVPKWKSYKIPSNIYNKKQFEEFLEELAEEEGIDTYEPFPFLIEGNIKASRYRVFSHNKNDTIVTSLGTCASCNEGEKPKSAKKRYLSSTLYKMLQEKQGSILGFYANQKGIITNKDSYTNMNFILKNQRVSGHMLNMMLGKDMVLKLPNVE